MPESANRYLITPKGPVTVEYRGTVRWTPVLENPESVSEFKLHMKMWSGSQRHEVTSTHECTAWRMSKLPRRLPPSKARKTEQLRLHRPSLEVLLALSQSGWR